MSNVRRATVLLLLAPLLAGALVCSSFGLTAAENALVARSTATADPSTWVNLGLPNPSFAEGLQHWNTVVGGAGSARATDRGHRDRSGAVLTGTASSPRATILSSAVALPLSVRRADGTEVRFAIWVRTTQPHTAVTLTLHAQDGSSLREVGSRTYSTRHTGWRRVAVTRKVGSSVSTVQASVGATDLSRSRRVRLDGAVLVGRQALSPETTPDPAPTPAPDGAWLSGASGDGVTDGQLGAWRGRSMEIAGTWNDNWESHEYQWSLQPQFGYGYGKWSGDIDNAVGGIYKNRGESWKAAASGAYDARWTRLLQNVTKYWGNRPGTMYLRFAHEFNGSWYPWSVSGAEVEDFKAAWRRFRALQLRHAPDAELVFCPSSETSSVQSLDWRDAFPGAGQVDVMAVDYYNQWPFVRTEQEFEALATTRDRFGAPRGLESHRRFAEGVGKPFAVSEWSSNSTMGDSPVFMHEFYDWLETHGGTQSGKVLYEIAFNVSEYGDGMFQLFPRTDQPDAALAYKRRW